MREANKFKNKNYRDVNIIIENYLERRNSKSKYIKNNSISKSYHDNTILNSTALSECLESICENSFRKSESNKLFNITKFNSSCYNSNPEKDRSNKTIKERVNDFTYSFYSSKHENMDRKEKELYENVNTLNFRYQDVNTNNYIINYLPRFKKISTYKNKVEKILLGKSYKSSMIENSKIENTNKLISTDSQYSGRPNKSQDQKNSSYNKNQIQNNYIFNKYKMECLSQERKVNRLNVSRLIDNYKSYLDLKIN